MWNTGLYPLLSPLDRYRSPLGGGLHVFTMCRGYDGRPAEFVVIGLGEQGALDVTSDHLVDKVWTGGVQWSALGLGSAAGGERDLQSRVHLGSASLAAACTEC